MTKRERFNDKVNRYAAGAAISKCKECNMTSSNTALYNCKKSCPSWDR